MAEPFFFARPDPLDLGQLIALTGGTLEQAGDGDAASLAISGLASAERAGPTDVATIASGNAIPPRSRAGACLVARRDASRVPAGAAVIVVEEPLAALAKIAAALYPRAARPQPVFGEGGVSRDATIHAEARLEPGVTIDPGAVIGPRVEIGRGAIVCANAVVGPGVCIGRGSIVGASAAVLNALVGDRVTIRQGARIGHEGVSISPDGLFLGRIPQIGRAIIQDDVDVGANAVIDRGAAQDTVIGEKSLVDALVHVGPDAVIGRCCVIFAQSRVGPGETLEDFTVLGDQPAARTAPRRS